MSLTDLTEQTTTAGPRAYTVGMADDVPVGEGRAFVVGTEQVAAMSFSSSPFWMRPEMIVSSSPSVPSHCGRDADEAWMACILALMVRAEAMSQSIVTWMISGRLAMVISTLACTPSPAAIHVVVVGAISQLATMPKACSVADATWTEKCGYSWQSPLNGEPLLVSSRNCFSNASATNVRASTAS